MKDRFVKLGKALGLINDNSSQAITGPYAVLENDRYAISVVFWFKTKNEAQEWLRKHEVKVR